MKSSLFLKLSSVVAVLLINGCAMWSEDEVADVEQVEPEPLSVIDITNVDRAEPLNHHQWSVENQVYFGTPRHSYYHLGIQGAYKGYPLQKHIGDYVKNMAQDLISNMEYVTQKTPVGVTHFALLDSDLQQTSLFGQQLAESFIHEMHKFRIPVIDFKTTNYVRVTPQGDFFLSRDYLELENSANIQYVLTGTLAKHQGGFMVNARMIGMKSRAVVATAQTFVPFYVVDALIPAMDPMVDGIRLSKGE